MEGKERASKWFDWRRDLLKELKRGAKARLYTMTKSVAEGSKDYTVWQPYKFPM